MKERKGKIDMNVKVGSSVVFRRIENKKVTLLDKIDNRYVRIL